MGNLVVLGTLGLGFVLALAVPAPARAAEVAILCGP